MAAAVVKQRALSVGPAAVGAKLDLRLLCSEEAWGCRGGAWDFSRGGGHGAGLRSSLVIEFIFEAVTDPGPTSVECTRSTCWQQAS